MMDLPPQPKRSWCSFIWKLFSVFRLLKHLALIWQHPIATLSVLLFLLLLYIPLMRPLVRFLFPLFAFTVLCIIAFVSFGLLMEQKDSQGSEEVGDHIAGWDILGLRGGWAAYDCFQSHISKQEDIDLHSLVENMKSTNKLFDVIDGSENSPKEDISLGLLEHPIEENKLLHLDPVDKLDLQREEGNRGESFCAQELADQCTSKQESAVLTSFSVPKKVGRRKIRVRFVDEVEYLHGMAGDKHLGLEFPDGLHSDTDASEDDDHSIMSEGSQEAKNHADGSCLLTEENLNYAADIEDVAAGSHESGQDTESDSETHETEDLEAKDDGLVSVELERNPIEVVFNPELEIKEEVVENMGMNFPSVMEAEIDKELVGLDVLSNFHQDLPYSGFKQEGDIEQDIQNESQMEDNLNRLHMFSCGPNLSGKSSVDSHSEGESEPQSEPQQRIESEDVMTDDVNVMDVPDLDLILAAKAYREVQSDRVTEQEQDLRQEIDCEIKMEDKISGSTFLGCEQISAGLLDHKLQPDDTSKQLDDPKKDPPKWRDCMRGVEIVGMSMWTSEKGIYKNANRNTTIPDFDQEITGIVTLEEEFTSSGAFIFVEENEHTPLDELGAFIQKLTEKLQAFEAESSQKTRMNEFADPKSMNNIPTEHTVSKEAAPTCTMKEEAAKLNFVEISPQAATPDSPYTEEGEASSRWDEALDTSEKESVDSEIEEGRIWPAPESDDQRMTAVEKEFGILKFDYSELEKEYRALQDEIRFPLSQKLTEEGKASEEDLDPYVKLFAQTGLADADAEVPASPYLHPEHHAFTLLQKSSKAELKSKPLRSKGLFQKSRLSSISKAIKGVKKQQ